IRVSEKRAESLNNQNPRGTLAFPSILSSNTEPGYFIESRTKSKGRATPKDDEQRPAEHAYLFNLGVLSSAFLLPERKSAFRESINNEKRDDRRGFSSDDKPPLPADDTIGIENYV
ncbi:hypothetical protein BgiBS90_009695, partial [Biomphalaria glabrata]